MYSRLRLAFNYLWYYLTADSGKGHGIHSPFVYDFVRGVLGDREEYACYTQVEGLRGRLLRDGVLLEVEDLGAGSVRGNGGVRKVADIARLAAKPPKLGKLLYRIARYYKPSVVVELGTSLGLSTAYLAAGVRDGVTAGGMRGTGGRGVWTIEGAAAVAERAAENLTGLGFGGVDVVTGNFDDVLEPLLARVGPVELAFVDGNHRCAPTLRYFNSLMEHAGRSAILIFDDIHWSAEMEEAWARVRADERVMVTIDLFFVGMVVIREEFKVKQEFTVRF